MRNAIIRWFVLTISVWVAAFVVPGIYYSSVQSLFIAALVLGVLNAFVKPVLTVLSFPFILVTLGLFMVLINTGLLLLTARLVKGFYVIGFWPAVGGALIISLVGLFMNRKERMQRARVFWQREESRRKTPLPGEGPIIDID